MTVSNPSSSACDTECCDDTYSSLEGYAAMTSGSSTVTVTFSTQPAEYSIDFAYVENTIDASPLQGFCWTCTARSLTGFTVKFNSAPDSANYVFYYKIKTARRAV